MSDFGDAIENIGAWHLPVLVVACAGFRDPESVGELITFKPQASTDLADPATDILMNKLACHRAANPRPVVQRSFGA